MDWLNYHPLLYLWTVAREGSIARAAETLLLAPPMVSTQIKALDESLGGKLFERRGRCLVLTEVGAWSSTTPTRSWAWAGSRCQRCASESGQEVIGQMHQSEERFYAITVQYKVAHKGVQAVLEGAQARLRA